ncbi:MAG: glycosyltransferase family 4 protein [Alcanivorax sp.]
MSDPLTFNVLLTSAIAFLVVVLLIMPVRKLARLSGIVDKPGGRKKHEKAIPPVGGIIIFTTFMVLGLWFEYVNIHKYWSLYSALILLLTVGALDDQFHIPAKIKMVVHILAAALISFWGNVQAAYLGDLFGMGVVWTGFLSYPFTITAIVLLINAMNLMDGMDGLVGGTSVVIFGWFIVACVAAGWYDYVHVLALLVACLCGFLVFNMRNPLRRRASLFLGDAGSMSVGLTIAWFSVLLARNPSAPLEPIVVAWIIGFPIFDTCAQFYRRVSNGKHPFAPDRGHFHHHFIDAGIPVRYASVIIISLIAVMGGIGYFGAALGVPLVVLTVVWIIMLLAHILMSKKPERYVRLIKKLFSAFVMPSRDELDKTSHDAIKGCVDKG